MIKKCPFCKHKKEMRINQIYCNPKCKKNYENSLRGTPSRLGIKRPKPPKLSKLPKSPKLPQSQEIPKERIPVDATNQTRKKSKKDQAKEPDNGCLQFRPPRMSRAIANYWDMLAPDVYKRGHLNTLSKRILYLYCVLQVKIDETLNMLNEDLPLLDEGAGRKSKFPTSHKLLQVTEKWVGQQLTQQVMESESSKLLRLYTARSLDYAKQLYLTPLSNRGNFDMDDNEEVDPHDEFLSMGGK